MPLYEFKCSICKKDTEVIISFSQFNCKDNTIMGKCSNKKCQAALYRENQQINFSGHINMNASEMGINQRSYNNKSGGPSGIVGDKVIGKTGI